MSTTISESLRLPEILYQAPNRCELFSFTPTQRCVTQNIINFFCALPHKTFLCHHSPRVSELIQPHKYAETIKNFIHYDVVAGNLSTQQQII